MEFWLKLTSVWIGAPPAYSAVGSGASYLTSLCLRSFSYEMKIITFTFLCAIRIHGHDLVCLAFLVDFCVYDVEHFLSFFRDADSYVGYRDKGWMPSQAQPLQKFIVDYVIQVHAEADSIMKLDLQEIDGGNNCEGWRKEEAEVGRESLQTTVQVLPYWRKKREEGIG